MRYKAPQRIEKVSLMCKFQDFIEEVGIKSLKIRIKVKRTHIMITVTIKITTNLNPHASYINSLNASGWHLTSLRIPPSMIESY